MQIRHTYKASNLWESLSVDAIGALGFHSPPAAGTGVVCLLCVCVWCVKVCVCVLGVCVMCVCYVCVCVCVRCVCFVCVFMKSCSVSGGRGVEVFVCVCVCRRKRDTIQHSSFSLHPSIHPSIHPSLPKKTPTTPNYISPKALFHQCYVDLYETFNIWTISTILIV